MSSAQELVARFMERLANEGPTGALGEEEARLLAEAQARSIEDLVQQKLDFQTALLERELNVLRTARLVAVGILGPDHLTELLEEIGAAERRGDQQENPPPDDATVVP